MGQSYTVMDIKVDSKSAFILKSKMLSMFAPFSQLSGTEAKVYGLLAYYQTKGVTLDDPNLTDYLSHDTNSSKQVLYNIKSKLKKKGLLNGIELTKRPFDLITRNEFNFNFMEQ